MRGVWVATVCNIDWPSADTVSVERQRAELTDLLDRAVAAGFNTVVFQVRPAADAVYRSSLEPWAALLTGRQGTDPGYDPLEFANYKRQEATPAQLAAIADLMAWALAEFDLPLDRIGGPSLHRAVAPPPSDGYSLRKRHDTRR